MKVIIITLLAILIPIFANTSCIVTSQDIHVEISCDDFTENPDNTRNEFDIRVGDKVYIELCSNQTTGFEWSYKMSGDNAVKEEDHDYHPSDASIPGAPGKETWVFEGVSKGVTEILMDYSRPWEGGEKGVWLYSIMINVE